MVSALLVSFTDDTPVEESSIFSGSLNEEDAQQRLSDTRGPNGPLLTEGVVTPQDRVAMSLYSS